MRPRAALVLVLLGGPGCLVFKPAHDKLATEVAGLAQKVDAQQQELDGQLRQATELVTKLEAKLSEAETLLRRNQADLGLRVETLESQTQELRGASENAEYVAKAGEQQVQELRAEVDGRLHALEQKLNEATAIPESPKELLQEAEKLLTAKNYKGARRLLRTFESRYPSDPKIAEVRFKIGLSHFSERDYKAALGEFYRVVQDSPAATVLPDALYYSGLSFAKLGQCKNAQAYFQAILSKKSNAPDRYKEAAQQQIQIIEKDKGELCVDRAAGGPTQAPTAAPRGGKRKG